MSPGKVYSKKKKMEFVPPLHTSLEEIFEHQGNNQKVASSKPYCRLCLKPALKNQMVCLEYFHDVYYPSRTPQFKRNKILQTEMYVKMLNALIPNFDHKLIFNPVMCPKCSNRLQRSSEFVEQCMRNQDTIRRYKELFSSTNKTISCEEVAKNQWKMYSPSEIKKHRPPISHKMNPSKKAKKAKPTENIIETAQVQKEDNLVAIKSEEIDINETYIKIEPHELIKEEETTSERIISIKSENEIKNVPAVIGKNDVMTSSPLITTPVHIPNVIEANSMVSLAPVQYCSSVPVPIQFVQQVTHSYINMINPLTSNHIISTNDGFSVLSSNFINLPNKQM